MMEVNNSSYPSPPKIDMFPEKWIFWQEKSSEPTINFQGMC